MKPTVSLYARRYKATQVSKIKKERRDKQGRTLLKSKRTKRNPHGGDPKHKMKKILKQYLDMEEDEAKEEIEDYFPDMYLDPEEIRKSGKPRSIMAAMRAHAGICRSLMAGNDLSSLSNARSNRRPFITRTQNGAPTLTTTGDALLDFVFQVLPDTPTEDLHELLESAWDANALFALRAVFQLRDIRQGKGDREKFYECIDWIAERHPQTLLANLRWFPRYGYWKDLLMFILRQLEGEDLRREQAAERAEILRRREENNRRITAHKKQRRFRVGTDFDATIIAQKRIERAKKRERNVAKNLAIGQQKKAAAHARRVAARAARSSLIEQRLKNRHSFFSKYYRRVVELFATKLRKDVGLMRDGKDVSFCGKWAPRIGGSFDRRCHLGRAIAIEMFSSGEEDGVKRACDFYRQEICNPLRRYLECPEISMSRREWDQVNYSRVPSVCMSKNSKHFVYHDSARFGNFLLDVADGTKKIASGAVMAHTLVESAMMKHDVVVELQFRSIIGNLRGQGTFQNTLAVCDVSGSMEGTPMMVAIALSMILADLSEGCWHKKMVTFSSRPTLFTVPEGTLRHQVLACKGMDWGCSTNYSAVFDLILNLARAESVPPAQMIKRLYVFSDMEFDASGGRNWETTHEEIERKYRACGYKVPQIVFWNLRSGSSCAIPASARTAGVALVSGFNASLLKVFMDGTDVDWVMDGCGEAENLVGNESRRHRGDGEMVLEMILSSERYSNIADIID